MVHLEGDDLKAACGIDDAIPIELLNLDGRSLRRQLLVLDANRDVERVSLLQMRHQALCTGRANDAEGPGSTDVMGSQPAGEPQVGDANDVVGVIVREQQRVDPADRHPELVQPDRRTAAGIDQQLLIARLDQRARTEAVGTGRRHARPEQGNLEIVVGAHDGSGSLGLIAQHPDGPAEPLVSLVSA